MGKKVIDGDLEVTGKIVNNQSVQTIEVENYWDEDEERYVIELERNGLYKFVGLHLTHQAEVLIYISQKKILVFSPYLLETYNDVLQGYGSLENATRISVDPSYFLDAHEIFVAITASLFVVSTEDEEF